MKLLLLPHGISDTVYNGYMQDILVGRKNLIVGSIPTAGDPIEWIPDESNPERSVARLVKQNPFDEGEAREKLRARGLDVAEVINADLKQDPAILREKLEHVDVINVGGGDVNYLLDWAKKSKLYTYLRDLLEKGVIYMGVSAGSMLPQPDIGFTWWEESEKWKGTDHVGLGIVDFITTGASKKKDGSLDIEKVVERKKHLQSIMNFPWKVYLLGEDQGIKVDGDKIEHLGTGEKVVI